MIYISVIVCDLTIIAPFNLYPPTHYFHSIHLLFPSSRLFLIMISFPYLFLFYQLSSLTICLEGTSDDPIRLHPIKDENRMNKLKA